MADAYKPVDRPDNGSKYYAYFLLYVGDHLCIYHDAEKAIYELDTYFLIKKGQSETLIHTLDQSCKWSATTIELDVGVQVPQNMCKWYRNHET